MTVAVRDQRHREHDPILGVVPLKLSEILQTSSQATRWYPLDGGIGFGHIRISLLFRSVETKLPPPLLGWDVGTFEIASDRIVATDYYDHAKLSLRSGRVGGNLPRAACHRDENGAGSYFDLSSEQVKDKLRLPLKHRHRSAVVFELHGRGHVYAILWLNTIEDDRETSIDIPIWSTKNYNRLTQNYITEDNWETKRSPGLEDLTKVGRLQFTGRFSPGIDESHERCVIDNESRETFETWEACISEGVRERKVSRDLPETVSKLHERSLVEGRDILRQAGPEERERWISPDGTDWKSAFGNNPQALADTGGTTTNGPGSTSTNLSGGLPSISTNQERGSFSPEQQNYYRRALSDGSRYMDNNSNNSPSSPLSNMTNQNRSSIDNDTNDDPNINVDANANADANGNGNDEDELASLTSTTASSYRRHSTETNEERRRRLGERANKRAEHRKQRGAMQWRPARNAAFAKHETEFALKKVKKKFAGGLSGREPAVETETG